MNFGGLGNMVKNLMPQWPPVGSNQEQQTSVATRIANQKTRRRTATDTAHGAIAVNLAFAGIHHAQVALGVNNLPGQCHLPQIQKLLARL